MVDFPFATRTGWPQQTNALNNALEEIKQRGISILDLTASNPTECGFAYPERILSALSVPENLYYQPEARGLLKARQAVATHYARQQIALDPKDIVLTAGTSEAYSFLMRLLVNPGEKVLIPQPSYPLFQFLLEINDVHFTHYPLRYDAGRWRLDFESLENLVDAQTKAIILVNPNNPTGSFISADELSRLNAFCRQHQLAIISDEVFFDFALKTGDFVSCAANTQVLTFVLGGLSKTLGLPQMKCSWIIACGPQGILQEALARLEIIADTYLSVNTPVQNALESWLEFAPALQKEIIERVSGNLKWLAGHLNDHTELLAVEGGWYATLRIPSVKTEEEWVLEFLKQDHVLVYPGYFFDFDREAYMVLSLLPTPSVFEQAVGRMRARLAKI